MRTAGQETATTGQSAPRLTATVAAAPMVPPAEPDEPPLLPSKLTLPDPPAGMVERPRPAALLGRASRGPVTLLAAPAGWGKTVLLSSWLAGGGWPHRAAWLTLEAGDEARFWSYLSAALTGETPRPGAPAGSAGDEAFLARLAATVAGLREPVLVVLDDFHLLRDPAVPRGLEFLLRHGNGRLRLVIAARSEPALPLHRWRLTGELTELRAADLAFTEAETAALLARHGIELPGPLVRGLHERTEGWAAGLRLAALALRADPDPARCAAGFAGDRAEVAEYVTAELLAPLPGELRDALRRTAVLERMCAGSADAVTDGHDGERLLAAATAEEGGFLFPVAGQPGWYRCHRLIGDLLHTELRRRHPDELGTLHRRASRWHADNGHPVAALRHALAGHDWSAAAELAAGVWPQLTLCGHDETLRAALPAPPPEALRAEPLLAVAYATDRLDAGDATGAGARLATDAEAPADTAAALAAARLARAELAGDLAGTVRGAHELAALLGPAADPTATRARVIALAALGGARLELGDLAAAQATLAEAAAAATAAGFACAERLIGGRRALLHALTGELTAAESAARDALAVPACRGRRCAGHAAVAHLALALVEQERERRPEAERELARAAGLATGPAAATGAILRARALAAAGDPARALEALAPARRALPDGWRGGHLDHWLTATEAQLRAALGDVDTARGLLTATAGRGGEHAHVVPLARLHLQAGEPAAALAALADEQLRDEALPLAGRLDATVVAATAAAALGDRRRAHRLLEEGLELAAAHGHRRVFTQGGPELRALLAAHLDTGTAHRSTVAELVEATSPGDGERLPAAPAEPLTERELTILRYLQSTLSNGEIAAELFLSVNTVKTHVRNIYQKLGAPRRREAVRRARELRLL